MYIKHEKLRDLTLGALAAEHDNFLEEYFFESRMFRRVALGHTRVLIGNRGSGKSAIFRMLAKKERQQGTLVEEIMPSDYMFDLLKNSRLFDSNTEWARLGAYTASWKYVILITAMRLLHSRFKKLNTHKDDLNAIHAFLRDHLEHHPVTPLDLLVRFMRKFADIKKVTFEGIQFGDSGDSLEKLYKLEPLLNVIPAIQRLSQHTKVLILFDELDQGWDASNDARQFIAGLFRAAIQINQQFSGIRVLITIREEIYQNIPELYEDAQKIRDIIEYVRWTPDELKGMITQRIKHALELIFNKEVMISDPDKLWEVIFNQNLAKNGLSSYHYIIDRTLYRPRELIFFVNECFKVHNLEQRIGDTTILQVEKNYSKNRLEDIAAEYRFQYRGLKDVFELFRLSPCRWTRHDLDDLWLEVVEGIKPCPEAALWLNENCRPDRLIEILWKVGFLRAFAKTSAEPEPSDDRYFVGYHQEPTLNIATINYFDIHPMFRSHLGIAL
ncbi:MAG: hypothetical protein ONB16_07860 [candidate division KSB1 bacterium]|nr:hypothetical protein [candidate division KSB1 bacterium]MDZ7318120.1 hypothetical protein [candidate division KSB1 bacterium]MDZ7340498.1 hypothetical protein [candidate division KSB1 bacterium]